MKRILLFLFFSTVCYTNYACINAIHHNKKKKAYRIEGAAVVISPFKIAFFKHEIEAALKEYDLSNIDQYPLTHQSDIGVFYLKLGEFEKALAIFEKLIQLEPNRYEFNSNLGSTYELLGKNKLALKFIKRGFEINPDSHHGSEGIHVKILEAKIAIAKNPDWINQHRILDLENTIKIHKQEYQEGDDKAPYPKDQVVYSTIGDAEYQLQSRLPFVPVPDLTTALIAKEIAELFAKEVSTSFAHGYASIAHYYAPNSLKKATKELEERLRNLTILNYSGKSYVGGNYARIQPIDFYLQLGTFTEGKNGVNWYKMDVNKKSVTECHHQYCPCDCIHFDMNDTPYVQLDIQIMKSKRKERLKILQAKENTRIGNMLTLGFLLFTALISWFIMRTRNTYMD